MAGKMVNKKKSEKTSKKTSKKTKAEATVEAEALAEEVKGESTEAAEGGNVPTGEVKPPEEFRSQYVLFKHSPEGNHEIASPFFDSREDMVEWFGANAPDNTKYRYARVSLKCVERVVETKKTVVGF